MKATSFYLGLGSLIAHELDSIPNHEWRVLPLIRALPDDIGRQLFIAAHVPIFAILIGMLASENPKIRKSSRIGISVFLVIHVLLHFLFKSHPDYEFSSLVSNLFIISAGIFGAVYLIFEGRDTYGHR